MRGHRTQRAFTLIELIVVIAIIAILSALVMAGVQKVRAAAQRGECSNHMRQIGIALTGYHDTHRNFPAGASSATSRTPYLGWTARILPLIEQDSIWRKTELDFKQQSTIWAHSGLSTHITIFVCPADGRERGWIDPEATIVAFTHYLGVSGKWEPDRDGVLFYKSAICFRDISDGTSNTVVVGERPPSPEGRFGWWYAGSGQNGNADADMILSAIGWRTTYRYPTCPQGPYYFSQGSPGDICDTMHFWSKQPGGAHFLFGDGSVRFLAYGAQSILPSLATRAGGEVVEHQF